MRISTGHHTERTSRSHCQHCSLIIKKNNQSNKLFFPFPIILLVPFFYLGSLPALLKADPSALPLSWLPLLHRWSDNLLHPLYTPLGVSLGIISLWIPHAYALSHRIFILPLSTRSFSTSFYVGLVPRARGRHDYLSLLFLFFAPCESLAQRRQL